MAANRAGPGAAAAAAADTPAKFAFTGFVNLGDAPLVCITFVEEQRSHWLKPGQSAHGVSLLNYESDSGEAIISHHGQSIRLALKERTFDPSKLKVYQSGIQGGPVRSAGLAEHVALTPTEKATEARMLVSDLLEIGMIQRKAYEEAKKKEIEEKREATKAN